MKKLQLDLAVITTFSTLTVPGVIILQGMQLGESNLVFGAQYSKRGEVSQADRDHTEKSVMIILMTAMHKHQMSW